MEQIDIYNKEQAEKLLQNIRILGDIRKLEVPNPESTSLEMTNLKQWIVWLHKRVERYGDFGIESKFIGIIERLDTRMQVSVERAEESVRRLLSIIIRQEKIIKENIDKIKDLEDKLEKFVDEGLKQIKNEGIEVITEEPIVEETPTEEVKPIKKIRGLHVPPQYLNK